MLKSCCPTLIYFIVDFIQIRQLKSGCFNKQHNYWCCNFKGFYGSRCNGTVSSEKATHCQLHEYGVTASYDEIRRFKISEAAASSKQEQSIRLEKGYRLIRSVSDNLDALRSTQNGLK